jgi:hypothetical protein
MDLAVKTRYFRHLLGGDDPEAEEVYLWHIKMRSGARMAAGLATDRWKRNTIDYITTAQNLIESMETRGFDKSEPIDIDQCGELLGGAHRLAAALALQIPEVPVAQYNDRTVWAPAWDFHWFTAAGMRHDWLKRTTEDFIELLQL